MMRSILVCTLVCLPTAASAQVTPADFARGAAIQIDGAGSIIRVVLPADVYATVTRPDLADLRVFNADGDAVPHSLRLAAQPRPTDAAWVEVPLFPFHRATVNGSATTHVRVGPRGTVLEVTNDGVPDQAQTAYLVDVTALEVPLAALSLAWRTDTASFLARIAIEGSDDLNQWRTIVPSAAIARMQHGSSVLTRSDIVLSGARARYLRIAWPKELAAVTLTSVRARPQLAAPAAAMNTATFSGRRTPDSPGVVTYDSAAWLPIEQLDIELADATDAASVTVRSRPDERSEWVTRHVGLFYSLTEANDRLTSAPVDVGPTSDRYWLVDTAREGGWREDRLPRLTLGWHPHELLFVTQGAGPYVLAYGSARVGATDAPVDAVLASLGDNDRGDRTREATLAQPRDLGGAAVLRPAPPWRRLVLWATLIGAVVALAGFALRVFREPANVRAPD